MTLRQKKYLGAYCAIGRKLILRYIDQQSCIQTTRLTTLTLERLGVPCSPQSVKLVVQVPSLVKAYVCGLTPEEMSEAREVHSLPIPDSEGGGWRGHVIAITKDRRMILDGALDQADAALGDQVGIRRAVHVFPSSKPIGKSFQYEATCVSEIGVPFDLTYASVDDPTYLSSPAWNDQGIALAADELAALIHRQVD